MKDFETELKNYSPPKPTATAKRRAVSAAMEAFNQAHADDTHSQTAQEPVDSSNAVSSDDSQINAKHHQGFQRGDRPTDETHSRSTMMSRFIQRMSQRSFTMGLASACVFTFGFVFIFPMLWQRSDDAALTQEKVSADVVFYEPANKAEASLEVSPPMPDGDVSYSSETIEEVVVRGIREAQSTAPAGRRQRAADIEYQKAKAAKASKQSPAPARILLSDSEKRAQDEIVGQDAFPQVEEGGVKRVVDEPVSTFSIDVDTASYSFVRRELNGGYKPEKDAIRIEEMVNYFDYDYPLPEDKQTPFEPTITVLDSPWKKGNKLVHIGLKGYDIAPADKPRTNLVFLLDVSGSMDGPDRLPLVIQSMELLLLSLHPDDTVAVVVYAGAAGTVLEPTKVREKQTILAAMKKLRAGGSTAGGQGLALAYDLAEANFDKNAVNRVVLATDGDFNVGTTGNETLQGFVERKRDKGIYLSILGFGRGNYKDERMQALAQNGNGVAAYIDTLSEAQKVLVQEASSALFPIAKDVKIQVEFNPQVVSEYRLIGYETRALQREDFNNDAVDAGDVGAGHTVTAIYEITPVGSAAALIDAPRYSANAPSDNGKRAVVAVNTGEQAEYGFFKLRYKLPSENTSRLIEAPIPVQPVTRSAVLDREVNFSVAVAAFSQKMKGSRYLNKYSYDEILELAQANKGEDAFGYRTEFVQLVRKGALADELLR